MGISGTGGGFKKFCRGEIDISDASRPILKKEMEACAAAGIKYFELPVAFDALTVVINPKNTFIKQLTVEELKKMWEPAAQGKITRWNQVNPAWPDAPMKLFGAGSDSGTFDYYLSHPATWTTWCRAKPPSRRHRRRYHQRRVAEAQRQASRAERPHSCPLPESLVLASPPDFVIGERHRKPTLDHHVPRRTIAPRATSERSSNRCFWRVVRYSRRWHVHPVSES